MGGVSDIENEALSNISKMDAATTSAMLLLDDYMKILLQLASLMPTYYTVADAEYAGTTSKFGDVPVPAFNQLSKSDGALNAADQAAAGIASLHPGISTLLAEFRAALSGPEARLNAIAADVAGIAAPDLDFNEDNYIADLIEDVKTQIMAGLEQPTGASTATEGRFYGSDSARRAAANQKELDDTLGEFASRGFSLPMDVLNNVAVAISAKQAADDRSADMEILIQMETLSLENRYKAIDAGLRYDQILLGHYERKMQRALASAKAVLEIGQNLAEMQFAVLEGLMEMQKANLGMVADGRRIVMEDLQANTRTFGQRVEALITEAGTYFEAYQADGHVYEIARRAMAEIEAYDLSENEIHLKTLLHNIHNGVSAADDNLMAFSRIADIRLRAATTGADLQTSLAKAVRRSITTVVQLLSGNKQTGTAATTT